MSDKMLDRVSKLLNQAERAEEGSPEREAFMERAMVLSQAHSIDLAVARAHQARKERVEVPEKRRFTVGEVGRTSNKNAFFADLMIAVCEANGIEVTISGNAVYVWGHGMPSDLDVCERLFSILAVQMVQEADAGLKRGDNGEWREEPKTRRVEIPEDERNWGGHKSWVYHLGPSAYYDERDERIKEVNGKPCRERYNENSGWYEWVESRPPPKYRNEPVLDADGAPVVEKKWLSLEDGRVWRSNFYRGFTNRARQRLREARHRALKEAGIDTSDEADGRAIALRDKAKEVRDYFEETNRYVLATGNTYGGATVNSYGASGQLHGDQAGQRAALGNERVVSNG